MYYIIIIYSIDPKSAASGLEQWSTITRGRVNDAPRCVRPKTVTTILYSLVAERVMMMMIVTVNYYNITLRTDLWSSGGTSTVDHSVCAMKMLAIRGVINCSRVPKIGVIDGERVKKHREREMYT